MQDKGGVNMEEPKQHSDAGKPKFSNEDDDDDIIESDVELDNTGVVEPDNDPPQKVSDPRKHYVILFACCIFTWLSLVL